MPSIPLIVPTTNPLYPMVFDRWTQDISTALVYIQKIDPSFVNGLCFYNTEKHIRNRNDQIKSDIKKIVRKSDKSEFSLVLVSYPTQYIKGSAIDIIIGAISEKQRRTDYVLRSISAVDFSASIDTALLNHPIPDLQFVAIWYPFPRRTRDIIVSENLIDIQSK